MTAPRARGPAHALRDPGRRPLVAAAALAVLALAVAVAYLLGGAPAAFGVVVLGGALAGLSWWAAASEGAPVAREAGEDRPETDEAPQFEETILTLRCGACGSHFDVRDPGRRPLRATCAACGGESELR